MCQSHRVDYILLRPARRVTGPHHVGRTENPPSWPCLDMAPVEISAEPVARGRRAKGARHDIGAVMAGPGWKADPDGPVPCLGPSSMPIITPRSITLRDTGEPQVLQTACSTAITRCVTGRIIVRPGAQKTDSKQEQHKPAAARRDASRR